MVATKEKVKTAKGANKGGKEEKPIDDAVNEISSSSFCFFFCCFSNPNPKPSNI